SSKGEPLKPPTTCPSCHSPVIVDGDFLLCSAKDSCIEAVVSSLIHFCQVMGLEGFGEKLIRRLFERGLLKCFSDIYRLNSEDLLAIDRMGDVLAHKLLAQVEKKRTVDLATFIRALGIKEIGTNVSEIVAANFHTLKNIRSLGTAELISLHGIGERIALSLVAGLKDLGEEIDRLLNEITVSDYEPGTQAVSEGHPLFGKSVVFTGKMAHLDRKSAQALVKKLGGLAPDAISSKTDYLVIGDEGSALLGKGAKSTKQKDAEKLIGEGSALKIISESEFLSLAESR
ncbi:MAG TPA: helix-hairpin-helix domain-containing protein, partial [Myxococcota bacterium]|nr:helix-hairpin-helix domain-containing protein [Myxococcota bacterium]